MLFVPVAGMWTSAIGIVVDKYLSEPLFNTKQRKTKGIIAGTKEIVELVGSSLNL
jgi:hypothetical protein